MSPYARILMPGHPRANPKGYVYEHTIVAERALGKLLPAGAEIHHVNEIKRDNRNANLVVCPNTAYHLLLHVRMDALSACGNAEWRKCPYCKKYDDPSSPAMSLHRSRVGGGYYFHRSCISEYRKASGSNLRKNRRHQKPDYQPKQREPRLYDRKFLAFLRRQPCCLCGTRQAVEAAHLRVGLTGMQRKPHDRLAVPLCAREHRDAPDSQHRMGDEAKFWRIHGINPFVIAASYYEEYGGVGGTARSARKIKPRKPRHLRAKLTSRNTLRKAKR